MFDILFTRTFVIVWFMLLITGWAAYLNKSDKPPRWYAFLWLLLLLFVAMGFSSFFPVNIFLVWSFAFLMWWLISPGITAMWKHRKVSKFLKERGIKLKKGESLSESQDKELENYLLLHKSNDEWNKIVAQAMLSTALAVFATSSLVFLSDIDFSFMWMFLFISLLILVVMWLLNVFVFKSKIFTVIKAYFWVLIFTWYLIYDFNNLEKLAWDDSWSTAIDLSLNLYLDIINLFLYILEIMWDS